ncbi:hypothetical protein [Pseudoalteromonas neustonica]|uniref:hypothetical protein n=1 Tax=Pseudoalteromonas neustonica TaxID=1840331 RepID=UPI0007DB01F2|nr:hypothetical protein [Pseudoalteromonas neustonica]
MNFKLLCDNSIAVKKQTQISRFSLKSFNSKVKLGSAKFLDIWTQTFNYEGWQDFIRDVNGHSDNNNIAIITKENYEEVSKKLHKQLPEYSLEQIKWSVISAYIEGLSIDSELIKKLLIRTMPMPLNQKFTEMHELGLLDYKTQYSESIKDEIIIGCPPTELGRYAAAISKEKEVGEPLATLEIVSFGLPMSLCKLELVSSSSSLAW